MEKHSKKRRILPVAIALVAIIALSGVAYAYWTSGGSGNGQAVVGTSASLNVSSDAVSGLVPDGADHAVTVHITNPATFSQSFSAVAISVNAGSLPGGCLTTWFTFTQPTVAPLPFVLAANGGTTDVVGQIRMLPSADNQDSCKLAHLILDIAVS